MYLAQVNIWNFRKYGCRNITDKNPSLSVNFKNGLNLIAGENDSGKTAIIDSIKYVLGTQSYDINRVDENDFYYDKLKNQREKELKIECVFKDFTNEEAAKFIEWINLDESNKFELRVRLTAKIKDGKIVSRITAGKDGLDMPFEARDILRTVYLKPLRDAENELRAGYKSRFAQILKYHPIFKARDSEKHELEGIAEKANDSIKEYFISKDGKYITSTIDSTLEKFMGIDFLNNEHKSSVNIAGSELNKILSKLILEIDENKVGLGTLNQLYMSMELLLLETSNDLRLALIEEIEAHIHPQAQLRVIKHLQSIENTQFIITTHSVTLASVVKVENLILCNNNNVFPLFKGYTELNNGDYDFLDRFLDATKSNLIFAKGVIFVEGDAENILIPTIAEIIDMPLEKYGVSIVNIGNIAFLRYSNIFKRSCNQIEKTVGIPVSIVTDLDVRPIEYYEETTEKIKYELKNISDLIAKYELEIDEDTIKTWTFNSKNSIYNKIKELANITKLNKNDKDCIDKDHIIERVLIKKNIDSNNDNYELYRLTKIEELISKYNLSELKEDINRYRFKKKEDISTKLNIYDNIDDYIEKINDIEEYKAFEKNNKRKKYEYEDIKLFTNNWTMEYDIALSGLNIYILAAIEIAKDIAKNDNVEITICNYIQSAKEKISKELEELTPEEKAYNIYKPLLKGNASKAVTAQYLAKILRENRENIKEILKTDKYIKYIVDAIYHASKIKNITKEEKHNE